MVVAGPCSFIQSLQVGMMWMKMMRTLFVYKGLYGFVMVWVFDGLGVLLRLSIRYLRLRVLGLYDRLYRKCNVVENGMEVGEFWFWLVIVVHKCQYGLYIGICYGPICMSLFA